MYCPNCGTHTTTHEIPTLLPGVVTLDCGDCGFSYQIIHVTPEKAVAQKA